MLEWLQLSQGLFSGGFKLAAIIVPLAGIALAAGEAQRANGTPKAGGPEEAGIRAALNAYLEGHATGQAEAFRRAFHPDARMLYARDGQLVKTEIADYIARAPGKPAADEAQRKRTIDFIDIDG